jgi:hypothetical protein
MLERAQKRAKHHRVPFSITKNDIVIPERCPVLGIVLKKGARFGHNNSPSLDRIKPELGYIPENVIVISHRANTLKSDGTLEEHEKVAQWMKNLGKR